MIKRSLPLLVVVVLTLAGGFAYGWLVDENFRALFQAHRTMLWVVGVWTLAFFFWLYVAFDYVLPALRRWLSRVTGVRISERSGIGLGNTITVWETQNAGTLGCGLELLHGVLNITFVFVPIIGLIAAYCLRLF